MKKAVLVYESKWGNTKLVAETIAEGITETSDINVSVYDHKEIDLKQPPDFDVILVGSPNHIGGATGNIKKFIDKLGSLDVQGKYAAAFDTYMAMPRQSQNASPDYQKVVKKIEKRISEKLSGIKLLTPGLSISVKGFKGPLTEGELPKCKNFGIELARRIGS